MVTPSNNRHKDVFSGLPPLPQRSTVVPPGLDEIPSSSGLRAISSKPRIRVPNTRNIGQQEPLIEQTPTRGPCKLDRSASFSSSTVSRQPTLNQPFITPTKPKITFQRSISMQGNPLLPPDNVENSMNPMIYKCLNEPPDRVQDTPLKVSSVSQGGLSQVPTSSPRADENGTNIYASLGWDDIDELI